MKRIKFCIFCLVIGLVLSIQTASAQTTDFNYQGSLKNGGIPANGNYDMQFTIYENPTGGTPQGGTITKLNVAVTNGVFSVVLDNGSFAFRLFVARYLEIAVRPTGGGLYTLLTPRQLFSASPYAISAIDSSQLGGLAANQYVTTTSGGTNFIRNSISQQAASNFHISGNGIIGGRVAIGMNPSNTVAVLDVRGRILIQEAFGSAGIFLNQLNANAVNAFVGMQNDNNVGFYGDMGGWGLTMNTVNGRTTINQLGAAGATPLCRNDLNEISTCSSSLRYKTNINPFGSGLDLISRLRPVSFNWLANNQSDFGLVAEEVAEIEPLLVSYNDKGEVEGVKYDRLGVVLINAVGEQQKQIEAQNETIRRQQTELDSMKKFICSQYPSAEFCQQK